HPPINNYPDHNLSMAPHEFGQRVHDDIRAKIERPQQYWCRDGVVDDQWNAVFVSDVGNPLDVTDVSRRIADAFAIKCASIIADQGCHGLGIVARREANVYAKPRQYMCEQCMCGSV